MKFFFRCTAVAMIVAGPAVAASPALAADMPLNAPYLRTPMMAPAFGLNWTGCYIGAEGGANWGGADNFSFDPLQVGEITGPYNLSGWLVGGTIGCNYQAGHFVFGLESDDSWTNKSGSAYAIPPFLTTARVQTKETWIATARGRIGWTFVDRWLIYITGGAAGTSATLTITDAAAGAAASQSNTRWGWTVGGGLEWGIDRNWSVKVEYLHVDFGDSNYFVPEARVSNSIFFNQNAKLTDDILRAGVNYRFGGM